MMKGRRRKTAFFVTGKSRAGPVGYVFYGLSVCASEPARLSCPAGRRDRSLLAGQMQFKTVNAACVS